ncbi:MAG: hypothetical protein RBR65_00575 [Aliarcobacter sp.]|jgi:hypothetical protein|nr:hypothetical protein [Aliarcobacter sp.]
MTSSINTFNFPKDMNLTIIKNSSKLSSYEQKNLAILILVRYKLAFFVKQNPNDEFINKLYAWLENNVMDFRDIDIAFTTYYNTKEGTQLRNELFKIVKPLEELAVYSSKLAAMNNDIKLKNIDVDNTNLIKAFILNLLDYWFYTLLPVNLKKQTLYFKEILELGIDKELINFKKRFKGFGYKDRELSKQREDLNIMYDSSFGIALFLFSYGYKIVSIPVRGARKKKVRK